MSGARLSQDPPSDAAIEAATKSLAGMGPMFERLPRIVLQQAVKVLLMRAYAVDRVGARLPEGPDAEIAHRIDALSDEQIVDIVCASYNAGRFPGGDDSFAVRVFRGALANALKVSS